MTKFIVTFTRLAAQSATLSIYADSREEAEQLTQEVIDNEVEPDDDYSPLSWETEEIIDGPEMLDMREVATAEG